MTTKSKYPDVTEETAAVLIRADIGEMVTPALVERALACSTMFKHELESFRRVYADLDRLHFIDDEGRLTPLADKYAAFLRQFLAQRIIGEQSTIPVPKRTKAGFTLTEIAIVLGIIGLILGSIWVAAGAVYQNLRLSKGKTELITVAQGIRSLYATQMVVDTSNGADETSSLISAKIFPSDMAATSGNTAYSQSAWAGSKMKVFSAQQPTSGSTGDSFQILFVNIPAYACIGLATAATGTGRDPGLVSVGYATTTAGTYITPAATTLPITSSAAGTGCGSGNSTDIAFTFTLQ